MRSSAVSCVVPSMVRFSTSACTSLTDDHLLMCMLRKSLCVNNVHFCFIAAIPVRLRHNDSVHGFIWFTLRYMTVLRPENACSVAAFQTYLQYLHDSLFLTLPLLLQIVFYAAWLPKPAKPVSYQMIAIAARTLHNDHACLVCLLAKHLGRPGVCSRQLQGSAAFQVICHVLHCI